MNVSLNAPKENILIEWQKVLFDYYRISFNLDTLSQAYFMDIGYRIAMFQFSPFIKIDKSNTHEMFKKAKKHWEDENGNIFKDLDTELRESLYEKAHLITFGKPAKTYGNL